MVNCIRRNSIINVKNGDCEIALTLIGKVRNINTFITNSASNLSENIMNVFVILGLTSVVRAIAVQKSTIKYEIPFTILMTILLAVLGLTDNTVSRLDGAILWGFFIVYMLYLLKMAKNGAPMEDVEEAEQNESIWKLVLLVVED